MTAGEITFRRAEAANMPLLDRMLREFFVELGEPGAERDRTEALLRHGAGPAPMFRAILALAGETPQGLAVYFPEFSTWRAEPGVYVQDLYLVPDARGSGLGPRLLAATLRDAASWGAAYLKLTVHGHNHPAMAFYRRLGFQRPEQDMPFTLEGAAFKRLGAMA